MSLPETLTYGDTTITVADLPDTSIAALLSRGLTHYLGNEQASKVTSWKKTEEGQTASESEIEAKAAALHANAVDALLNGTVGTRSGGPKLKGIDRLIRIVAEEHLRAYAAKKNLKVPAKKDQLDPMVEKFMGVAVYADAVKAEAQRRFDAQGEEPEVDIDFAA